MKTAAVERRKTEQDQPGQFGATMSGSVTKVLVKPGDQVKKGEYLIVTEAMKMETAIQAPMNGVVKEVFVKPGDAIEPADLLIEFE